MIRALLVWLLFAGPAAAAGCRADAVFLRGDWGQARFTVQIADDAQERARGLMHREHMASSAGMLFLYEHAQPLSFWMRNTLIELDIIFLDAHGVVRHVHHRAQPLDETPVSGGDDLLAVLEINGGLAKAMGIAPGSQLRHPFFGAQAAWPC